MVDSQEHVDLVKARQEVLMTKAKFHSQQAELIMLRAQNQDKEQLINNLNRLLHQKNISLSEMQRQINILQQQTFRSNSSKTPPKPLNEYKEPMIDRIFRFFSDRLG
jgi:glycine cleavage system regulatory protein